MYFWLDKGAARPPESAILLICVDFIPDGLERQSMGGQVKLSDTQPFFCSVIA